MTSETFWIAIVLGFVAFLGLASCDDGTVELDRDRRTGTSERRVPTNEAPPGYEAPPPAGMRFQTPGVYE